MKKIIVYAAIPVLSITLVLFSLAYLNAEESQFRKQFMENYYKEALQAQAILIKKNKDIIETEVNALITEAMLPEKTFQQRMQLLDFANAIATMHIQWNNGSEDLLKKVETLQKEEYKKERARTEEIEKLKEAEKVPGNFVMTTRKAEMDEKGLSPVIYPHWVHRSFFRCKVCHEGIFIKERGVNKITHETMDGGRHCGTCHNGKMSFASNDAKSCVRCHLFGLPASKPIIDMSYYNADKFKEIAARVGSQWFPEKLPNGTPPVDRFGFINWVQLDKLEAFKPKVSLDTEEPEEGVRDTFIFFEMKDAFLKGVLFSHKIHSTWMRCSVCHPRIFKPEAGANRVTMLEIKDGKACGKCHGRVSFTYKDCLRCHKQTKENLPDGVLINAAGASTQTK